MSILTYPSDVNDAEQVVIELLVTPTIHYGRPRLHPLRRILNVIFYLAHSGCVWRLMLHGLSPWKTAFH